VVPCALLGGALLSQYVGGLVPCEMCMWQRWPHLAAICLAFIAILLALGGGPRAARAFVALAVIVSGAIGVFHAGVEYHWWRGPAACTAPAFSGSAQDVLAQVMAAPVIRCDAPQWTLFGVSLAGFNAIFSIGFGILILWLNRFRPAR
ncbi:MAG TPA: disulfide bond formation protein B, partial [Sphingomonas sp.]|nr:disulfide bond formation protein B [Sphingomonas sp.]